MAKDDGGTGRSVKLDLADPGTWPELMTVREVAQALRVNERTVLAAIGDGRWPATKVGTGYRISKRWLLRYVGGED